MTATTSAPPQLALPGQVHTAPGPHDLSGMFVAHHGFRRDLYRFAAATRATPVDDVRTWSALATRWARFGEILHHHHVTEDTAIWPELFAAVDAQGDRGAHVTLDEMEAEHDVVDPMLAACAAAFAAMAAAPTPQARAHLAEVVHAARDSVYWHLAHEETEALPILQRHLSATGWRSAERMASSERSPRKVAFLVPWLADGLPEPVFDQFARAANPALKVVLSMTRARYQRAEAMCFRHI
ncbi:hemerythrin domain-containing protein [Geodermatophilus sp. SYSU D00815]